MADNNDNIKEKIKNSRVLQVEVNDEIKKSFIAYAMAVNVSRAIPDVRDGMKPVQRRILYSMGELNLFSDKPYRKCARIVGDCLGKYHPHGDSSVYGALVRLAQDFSIRCPLVDGHGNFGSVDGDPPAAMRYTEARLSKIASEMLRDLDKETVDWYPNFDDTLMQPTVLPSRFPNLLVNGSDGIAVGMATNIPPHNLGEVIDAVDALIDNPDITVDDNASEFVDGNAAANGASAPVVFCRNRMNVSTQFWRQRCPDHNSVKMARMVGKVDALARRRRATLPVWVGADKKSRKPHNGRHQFKGAEHGKKSLYAGD